MSSKTWMPKVMSEYEIGRCMSAITAVMLLDKPIAEVMTRKADRKALESDIRNCIRLSRTKKVQFFIRKVGPCYTYGFYREPWALRALNFMDKTNLDQYNRDWINGLLFGYHPRAIEEFLRRNRKK